MKKKLAVICSLLLACGSICSLNLSAEEYALGDVTEDGIVNASDAARVLVASANIGSGQESGLTDAQFNRADYNQDGKVNASDASGILTFAAEQGAGLTENSDSSVEETINSSSSSEGMSNEEYEEWLESRGVTDRGTLPGGVWDGNFY